MANVEFDFSDLENFAVEITGASAKTGRLVQNALKTSAFRGKGAWRDAARRNAGGPLSAYPVSIDYDDVKVVDGGLETELGPNLASPQGPLGIVEDAPGGVQAAPQRNYEKAQRLIEQDLVKGVLQAVEESGV